MNIFRRIADWYRERGKTWLIGQDFPDQIIDGNLQIGTPYGIVGIPEWREYDRYTGVYDTPHPEMWRASALHDECVIMMRECGYVFDIDGRIIMTTWHQINLAFYIEMVQAIQRVGYRLHAAGLPPQQIADELQSLTRRAGRYHAGVEMYLNRIRRIARPA